LNKNELVAEVATAGDFSKADAAKAVEAVFDVVGNLVVTL